MAVMDVMDVHLIRHGAVEADGRVYGARLDPPLSPSGHAEVDALRARLRRPNDGWRLVRSPTRRAEQTLARMGLGDAVVDGSWSERDLGAAEGGTWAALWASAPPAVSTDPAAFVAWTPPDGESVPALRQRVVAALEELTTGPDAVGVTLVVTHGGPIVCAVAHVLGLDDATATRIQVATATVTTLRRYGEDCWTIRSVGG